MHAAFALLPSLVVLAAVLGLGTSGLTAAAGAALSAAVVWAASIFGPPTFGHATRAAADAAVLTALVAAMMVPGILFVEATRGRKSPEAIRSVVSALGLPPPQAAILISTGIGILIESLTGMGVSLLVTMPLLLGHFSRRTAIGLGLVGMSLMPWGALSISAHVGAKIAGMKVESLQGWIAAISGPVAFCLPLICLLLVKGRVSDVLVALASGGVLAGAIALASSGIGIEVAGVAGGLSVIALMIALAGSRRGLGAALKAPGLVPYALLIAAVVAQKLAVAPLHRMGLSPTLATDRVSFAVLTSPGLALLIATLLSAARAVTPTLAAVVARRAWRPIASIALFMLAARLLVECGAIAALAQSLGGLGRTGAAMAVALLGSVGGFVTGSGITGNALFMPSAAAAGVAVGALPVFAALQNGASGHFGMASLPVAALLLASLPNREAGEDARVLRTALLLASWHVAVATLAALILLRGFN